MARAKKPTEPSPREVAILDVLRRAGATDEADACRRWGCATIEDVARVIGVGVLPPEGP